MDVELAAPAAKVVKPSAEVSNPEDQVAGAPRISQTNQVGSGAQGRTAQSERRQILPGKWDTRLFHGLTRDSGSSVPPIFATSTVLLTFRKAAPSLG